MAIKTIIAPDGGYLLDADSFYVTRNDKGQPVVGIRGGGAGGSGVDSVNGKTGVVSLTQDDIPDGENALQFTTEDKEQLVSIESSIPLGGKTGQALVKASDNDRDTKWGEIVAENGVPETGSAGGILIKDSNTGYDSKWSDTLDGGEL